MKQKQLKLVAVLLCFMSAHILQAQEAVTSAGGNGTGTGGSTSYSVGQVAYLSIFNSNGSVRQGVQHPFEIWDGENENKDIYLELSVYPNPTMSKINLKIENQRIEKLSYQLFDPMGKLLWKQKIFENVTSIPMESLPTATYILKVICNKKEVKTFKIIKNN